MNIKGLLKPVFLWTILLVYGLLPITSMATPFFFPDMNPSFKRSQPPEWLSEGKGNDGYLTITSEIIPVNSCTQMSTQSFWGSDKTQLVISVVTNGFKSKLDKLEIPIATFDGREGNSRCASLSAPPTQIVPVTNLSPYSLLSPGNLLLSVNVKSSNNSNQDFIGSAKLLLSAVAIVATGGSAAAITGVTSAVGTSAASDTQTRANALLQGMIDAKIPVSFNWSELRKGIDAIEIFVYKTDQNLSSISDKQIAQLQKDPKADKQLLFTVKLEFQFFRTLFYPTVSDIDGLVNRENLSAQYVLNYPVPGSNQNFMQLLNNSSPSLLQRMSKADTGELAKACSMGFDKLKSAGLNYVDSAIVMKAFLDEARGDSSWYANPTLVKNCFSQTPGIQAYLERIYGVPIPEKQEVQ